jgi:outer membrane protein
MGTIPKGDLLDVKATVASDNQRVIIAENTLMISKLSLAIVATRYFPRF